MQEPTFKSSPPAAAAKPAAKPADAKPAATKPPAAAKPPVKKKSGSGCLPLLILMILVSACAAAYYYYPQQVQKLIGIKLPAFIPTAATQTTPPAVTQEESAEPAVMAAAENTEPTSTSRGTESVNKEKELTARLQQLQQTVDTMRRQLQEMEGRQAGNERQIARFAAQMADINQKHGMHELYLQIIALRLQLDGDTAAAAAALTYRAAATQELSVSRAMLDEAARLENIPARDLLLSLLGELRTAPAAAAETAAADETIQGKIKKLFNVRHTPTAAPLPMAQDQLMQLELLLLTRRENAYWRLLQQMRSDGGGSVPVRDVLQRLHDYGPPDYRLRLE